jgi:hypothetical protein
MAIKDARVRAMYRATIASGSEDLLAQVRSGTLAPAIAVQQANDMRKECMLAMRKETSPIGYLIAKALKPDPHPLQYYLEWNSSRSFEKAFRELSAEEAQIVNNLFHPYSAASVNSNRTGDN